MIYLRLFYAFVRIGLFAFGGGYATLPLINTVVIDELQWMTYAEFTEIVAISELTPGPIAVNAATYVGYKVAGLAGAFFATLGVVLPSVLIILGLIRVLKAFETNIYIKKVVGGLRPAVIALIAAAAYTIIFDGKGIADIGGIIIAVVAFLLVRSRRLDPVLVLVLAGVSGIVIYL